MDVKAGGSHGGVKRLDGELYHRALSSQGGEAQKLIASHHFVPNCDLMRSPAVWSLYLKVSDGSIPFRLTRRLGDFSCGRIQELVLQSLRRKKKNVPFSLVN
jgi:hypothetical protein